jgi:plastocyanin
MKKPILTALALCALLLTVASLAMPATAQEEGTTQPTTHEVTVTGSDMVFTPADLSINKGDTVYFHWSGTSLSHNVAQSSSADSNEYDGQGWRSGEASATVDFNVTFDKSGTFFYICEPHAGLGMKGSIKVFDPDAVTSAESTPGFTFLPVMAAAVAAGIVASRAPIAPIKTKIDNEG